MSQPIVTVQPWPTVLEPAAKICAKCQEYKPRDEFHQRGKTKHSYCKDCRKTYQEEWYQKSRLDPNSSAYPLNRRLKHVNRQYGLTASEYLALYDAQKGKCAICEVSIDILNCNVDHDHTTGEVRGLLHKGCNHGLGLFNDDAVLIRKALYYLENK